MKIGILTFHHTANYGATLQAYALCQTIKNQGHKVEIIDYRPDNVEKHYWKGMQFIKMRPLRKGVQINPVSLAKFIKYIKFRSFLYFHIPLSKKKFSTEVELNNFNHQYDMVLCGSDQVWCLDTSFRDFDLSYFLDFIDSKTSCKKASYAASFGSTENLGTNQELISKLISEFHAISVRDSNSLRIIQSCNQNAKIVLDPTFLGNYSKIILEPKTAKKYLLIYNQGNLTVNQEKFIKNVTQEKDLLIISIGRYNKIADNSFLKIGLGEWIGYFQKASYVVTNTYHGVIFSLIYNKEFTVFPYKKKQQKVADLLNRLDLGYRILDLSCNDVNSIVLADINWDITNKNIEEEKINSKMFLLNEILGEHKT